MPYRKLDRPNTERRLHGDWQVTIHGEELYAYIRATHTRTKESFIVSGIDYVTMLYDIETNGISAACEEHYRRARTFHNPS